jgi:hypothetical protein
MEVSGLRAGRSGSRVRSRWGLGIFLFTTASRTALGPTRPPIQWVPGAFSLWVKRPGCKADHYLHLVPRSKNAWSHTYTALIRFHGLMLSSKTHSDNFTFYMEVLSRHFCRETTENHKKGGIATRHLPTQNCAAPTNTNDTETRLQTSVRCTDHERKVLHGDIHGTGGTAPRILIIGTRWRWVVSFTPR